MSDETQAQLHEEIRCALLEYLTERHGEATATIDLDTPLVETGVLDSLGFVEFIAFIQSHFGVEFQGDDYTPENVGSIAACIAFISERGLCHEQ